MNSDFLSDAMNEISDEHIEEAVSYGPKVKLISRKNVLVAACIIAVTVSALFAYNHLQKPPSEIGVEITAETEISDNGTTSQDVTKTTFASASVIQGAPPSDYDNWENEDLPGYFSGVRINGVQYNCHSSYCEPVDKSILLRELGRINVYDYVKEDAEYIDLIVYEVKGISKDYAVAVGREDGLMRGTFLYIENGVLYSDTIGEIIDKLTLTEDIITIPKIEGVHFQYYNYNGSNQYIEPDRIILDENQVDGFCREFFALLKNSRYCKREDENWGEAPTLSFHVRILEGFTLSVNITTDGYIAINNYDFFKVSKEQCESFISSVTKLGLPQNFDIEKELEGCQTLGELTNIYSLSVQSSYLLTYCETGKDFIMYSLSVASRNLIDELVRSNSDAAAVSRVSDSGDKLVFDTAVNGGVKPEIYLCSDGYLYVSCKSVKKAFYIGVEEYNAFMTEFKKSSCIFYPEEPVTMG